MKSALASTFHRSRSGAVALILIGAALLLGACAAGRLTSPPPGYKLRPRRVQLLSRGKTETSASAPFFNMANKNRLAETIKKINFKSLVRRNLSRGIPRKLRRYFTRRGRKGRLKLYVQLEKADLMQPIIGADWYLRINMLGTLMDMKTKTELWKYRLREVSGVEMNGRKLKSLSTDQLIAKGGRRLKRELSKHIYNSIRKVLGDLYKALQEARKAK